MFLLRCDEMIIPEIVLIISGAILYIIIVVDVVLNYIYNWNGIYILYTQRCWFVYIFQMHKIGRREATRRYFLGSAQSE